jgi:hypothetical protein
MKEANNHSTAEEKLQMAEQYQKKCRPSKKTL